MRDEALGDVARLASSPALLCTPSQHRASTLLSTSVSACRHLHNAVPGRQMGHIGVISIKRGMPSCQNAVCVQEAEHARLTRILQALGAPAPRPGRAGQRWPAVAPPAGRAAPAVPARGPAAHVAAHGAAPGDGRPSSSSFCLLPGLLPSPGASGMHSCAVTCRGG